MSKKMLSHLRRKGDPRIGQRGKFNPTALFNFHNGLTADAADNLRRLVNRTYPDRAEEVKSLIRDRLDNVDIPDENSTLAEAITSLKAIATFYHLVTSEIMAGTFELPQAEPTTIFEMARRAIEGKRQWTSGESVTIWSGKTHKVYITEGGDDGGGLLYLDASKGLDSRPVGVVVGMLVPLAGWRFTLTQYDYDAWVSKTKRIFKATVPSWKPDLTMDFGPADLSIFREGRLSPEYAKRARRARSLR